LDVCRNNFEVVKAGLRLRHELGDKTDTVQWDEFEGPGTHFTHCGGKATRVTLVDQDTIHADKHSTS